MNVRKEVNTVIDVRFALSGSLAACYEVLIFSCYEWLIPRSCLKYIRAVPFRLFLGFYITSLSNGSFFELAIIFSKLLYILVSESHLSVCVRLLCVIIAWSIPLLQLYFCTELILFC